MPLSWFNENAGRAYPLRQDRPRRFVPAGGGPAVLLPDELLVEAGFVLGPDATGYSGTVRLAALRRPAAEVLELDVAADGVGTLTFALAAGDPEWPVLRAAAASPGAEVPDTLWEGYLVAGRPAVLLGLLGVGQTLLPEAAGAATFEPTLVQETGPRLRSLCLGNLPRLTTADATPADPETVDVVPVARGLAGEVRLADGYNLLARARARDGTLELVPGLGLGAGTPPGEVPLPGEVPPDASGLYSGGPSCAEVVQAVAGVSAAWLPLRAGPGLVVRPDPEDPHGVVVERAPDTAEG